MRKRLIDKIIIIFFFVATISTLALGVKNYVDSQEYVRMNVLYVINNNIVFGNNCTGISAITTEDRSKAIKLGQTKTIEERPLIHDTIKEIFDNFGLNMTGVYIESKDENYFYSFIIIEGMDKVLKVESIPSEAIALALRTDTSVYIKKDLLKKEGKNICD